MNKQKITVRIHPETYAIIQEDAQTNGACIDQAFQDMQTWKKREVDLVEQVKALQKEKKLLFELVNKMNILLDIQNTLVANLDVTDFIAHDVSPTEVVEAARLKQEGRISALRNYTS
ncbi:hypothetical protein [Listeria goaensis]|uniref:hypothetical protein n=1 Tax=Listeria goaensis TaxID=1649188 RepID=UPI000B58A47D|nr:hypothetical protein [Listeria goaensis]